MILASLAQAADPPSAFDVASIRPAVEGRPSIEVLPSGVTARNTTLRALITWAYNVIEPQVSGPDWLNSTRFDIVAKPAAPSKDAEMRRMMQTLLAERFKLELRRQTKETSAMVLTVAKGGHKLKEVEQEGSPSFSTGKLNLTGKGATIAQLIGFLSREIRLPIVDQTGLTGRYDYFMDISAYITDEMRTQGGPPVEAASIIANALQSQLGLKVEAKKMPLEMLVVEKMEKSPTEN